MYPGYLREIGFVGTLPRYMDSWAHLSPRPKRHLDWFGRFSTAHVCDQQTHVVRGSGVNLAALLRRTITVHTLPG